MKIQNEKCVNIPEGLYSARGARGPKPKLSLLALVIWMLTGPAMAAEPKQSASRDRVIEKDFMMW